MLCELHGQCGAVLETSIWSAVQNRQTKLQHMRHKEMVKGCWTCKPDSLPGARGGIQYSHGGRSDQTHHCTNRLFVIYLKTTNDHFHS